ncbi:MAG: aldo/keto reductase [Anaerolineae bacterium]|nr:aldo/keto reductase [Thermoflexales bacterium]MDW8407806.1 aldo/keto reductase [Anaerolineae bacterium]
MSTHVPIPKRLYKSGVELSIIGLGGIVVCGIPQDDANQIVAEAFERGVNYYDVAPTYFDGEAEIKLGHALRPYRSRVFLACKTEKRDAAGAQAALEESLRRAHTDYFDLYQFHAVTTMEELEQIFAPGGAAEVFLKAKQAGKVRFLGASCHSVEAAIALMDRFPLDSILFPINFVNYVRVHFGPQVIEHAQRKGVARLALKAMAHRPWRQGEPHTHPKAWYKPVDDRALARLALRFTLSEDVTAAIPPGDSDHFRFAMDVAADFTPLTHQERVALLSAANDVEPIFRYPAVAA